jgi:hypothetical protein
MAVVSCDGKIKHCIRLKTKKKGVGVLGMRFDSDWIRDVDCELDDESAGNSQNPLTNIVWLR